MLEEGLPTQVQDEDGGVSHNGGEASKDRTTGNQVIVVEGLTLETCAETIEVIHGIGEQLIKNMEPGEMRRITDETGTWIVERSRIARDVSLRRQVERDGVNFSWYATVPYRVEKRGLVLKRIRTMYPERIDVSRNDQQVGMTLYVPSAGNEGGIGRIALDANRPGDLDFVAFSYPHSSHIVPEEVKPGAPVPLRRESYRERQGVDAEKLESLVDDVKTRAPEVVDFAAGTVKMRGKWLEVSKQGEQVKETVE